MVTIKDYEKGYKDLREALCYKIKKMEKIIKTTDDNVVRLKARVHKITYEQILNSIGKHEFILDKPHSKNITKCLYPGLEFNNNYE